MHRKNSGGRTLVSHFNKQPGDADGYGLHANDFSNSEEGSKGIEEKFGIRFRRPKERNEVEVLELLFGVRREDWQKPILGSAYEKNGTFAETDEANMHIDIKGKGYVPDIADDSISRHKSRNFRTNKNYNRTLELNKSNLKYFKQHLPLNKRTVSIVSKGKVFSTSAPVNQTLILITPSLVKKRRVKMNESNVLFIIASFPFIVGNPSSQEKQFRSFNLATNDTKLFRTKASSDFMRKMHIRRNKRFIEFNSYVNQMTCGERCKYYNTTLIKKDNYLKSKFYPERETPTSINNRNLKEPKTFLAFKTLNSGNVTTANIFINQSYERNQRSKHNKPFTYAVDLEQNTKKSHPIDKNHQFKEDPESRPISDNIETDVDDEDSETYHGDKVTVTPFYWNESSVEEDDLVPRSTNELRKKSELQIYEEKSLDKDSGVLKTGTEAGDQLSRGIRKEGRTNEKQYIYRRLNDLNAGSKDPEESFNHKGIRENGKSLKSSKQTFRFYNYLSPTEKISALLGRSESIKNGSYQGIKEIVSGNGHIFFTLLKPMNSNKTNTIGFGNAMPIKSKEMKSSKKYKTSRMKRNASKSFIMHPGTKYSKDKFHNPDISISSLSGTNTIDSIYSPTNWLRESILTRHKRQFERTPSINNNGNANQLNRNWAQGDLVIVINRSALPIAAYMKKNDLPRENSELYNNGWNSGKFDSETKYYRQNQSIGNTEIVTSHPLEYRDQHRYLNVLPISSLAGDSQKTSLRQTSSTPHSFLNTRLIVDKQWRVQRPAPSPVRNTRLQPEFIAPQQHSDSYVTTGRPRDILKSWFETRILRGNSKLWNGNGPPQIWYIILPVEKSHNGSVSPKRRATLQKKNDEAERPALPQRESEDHDSEDVIRTPIYFYPKERREQFTPRGAKHNKPSLRQYERYVEEEPFKSNNDTDQSEFLNWFNSQWGFIHTTTPEGEEMTTNHPNDVDMMKQPDNQLTTEFPYVKHTTKLPNVRNKKQPNNIPNAGHPNTQGMTEQPNKQNTIQYTKEQFTTVQAMFDTKLTIHKFTTKKPNILLSTMLPTNHREPKQLTKQQTTKNPRIKFTTKSLTRISSTTKSSNRVSSTTKSTKRPSLTTKSQKRPSSTTKSPKRPPSTKLPKRPATTKSSKRPTSTTMKPSPKTVITIPPATKKPESIINKPVTTHDPWWDYHHHKKVWKKPVPCSKGFVPNNPWKIWHKTTKIWKHDSDWSVWR